MLRAARPRVLPAVVALCAALGACTASSPAPSPSSSDVGEPSPPASAAETAGATASEPSTGEPAWTPMDDAPIARLEMATAAHGGRIWMAGGLSPLGEVFDPASGEWSNGPSLPTGLHHAALVSDGERLLLLGGYVGPSFNQPTDAVLVLADGADAWEPGPPLPQVRSAGAAAWDGSRVVFAGGIGPGGVSGDVFVLGGEEWTRLGAMPRAREHLAAASDGEGRTWLLGGRVGGLDSNLADVDLVEGDAITSLDPLPTPRGGVGAFHLPELGACLTGGEAPAEAYLLVECVSADGAVSTAAPMTVRRHGHGAAVVDGVAYVLLGGPTPALSAHASVERLDPTP
jgi:hypothetical protein